MSDHVGVSVAQFNGCAGFAIDTRPHGHAFDSQRQCSQGLFLCRQLFLRIVKLAQVFVSLAGNVIELRLA